MDVLYYYVFGLSFLSRLVVSLENTKSTSVNKQFFVLLDIIFSAQDYIIFLFTCHSFWSRHVHGIQGIPGHK